MKKQYGGRNVIRDFIHFAIDYTNRMQPQAKRQSSCRSSQFKFFVIFLKIRSALKIKSFITDPDLKTH